MHLTPKPGLQVNLLAACFNNTVTSYKFYWFLAILDAIDENQTHITKRRLFSGMVANAWYTVNYYHLGLGKQDQIERAVNDIKLWEPLSIDDKTDMILRVLLASEKRQTHANLWHFDAEVPHRFLSPWFSCANKKAAYESSRRSEFQSPYALYEDHIEMEAQWFDYIKLHSGVLREFCYWNLAVFLQGRNPNVPGIPNKLLRPALRSSLDAQRKNFWDPVISELGSVKCIYTNKILTVGNYHVEHFIPYSFLTHDLIWNLVPADQSFNCSKSNKLPSLDLYFDKFYEMHRSAVDVMQSKYQSNNFLDDYLTIFSSLNTDDVPGNFSAQNFRDRLAPLVTIASNNGFEYLR